MRLSAARRVVLDHHGEPLLEVEARDLLERSLAERAIDPGDAVSTAIGASARLGESALPSTAMTPSVASLRSLRVSRPRVRSPQSVVPISMSERWRREERARRDAVLVSSSAWGYDSTFRAMTMRCTSLVPS